LRRSRAAFALEPDEIPGGIIIDLPIALAARKSLSEWRRAADSPSLQMGWRTAARLRAGGDGGTGQPADAIPSPLRD